MAIQWKDEYKIGHPEIDAHHHEIFKRANAFLDIMDIAALTEYAVGFFQYTRDQFRHQEILMRHIDYPALERHIEQHQDLTTKLDNIAKKIGSELLTHQDFEVFLTDYLVGHIKLFDTKLAAYINQSA